MARHRFAFVLLPLLVLVIFLQPLAKREVFTLRDHTDYFQPLRYFTAIHLKAFVLPYWNPYSASGEPWLANPQTGAFYPPVWLFAFLPFETAYMLFLALHLVILGWGAYLLFARRVSEPAALVGAVAVVFSGPVLSLLDVSNNLATFAWVPWVMWAAMEDRRPRLSPSRWTGGGACPPLFLALAFLAGEPYFAMVAAVIYAVIVRDPRRILLTGVLAAGLSAVQLVPFIEMMRGSDRAAGLTAEQIFADSVHPKDWLRIAIPPALNAAAYDRHLSQHFVPVVYVGLFVAVLAVVGAAIARRSGWLLLLLAAIVISAGSYLPLGALFEHLPVTLFRYPARMIPFGALAIAALAAIGWDRFRRYGRWVDLVLIAVVILDIVPRVTPLLATAPWNPQVTPYSPLIGRTAKIARFNDRAILDRGPWIGGYLNLYHRRYDAATAAPLMNERYRRFHEASLRPGNQHLLDLSGVGFILSARPLEPLRPIVTVRGVAVFANPRVTPMATFWSRAVDLGTADASMRATIERKQSGAIPELALSGSNAAGLASADARISAVELLALDSRQARVVVNAPSDGILLLTQQDAPAWRVYVDGRRAEKLVAAGVFRAVRLSKGRHEVIWKYESRAMKLGMSMTIITALAMQLSTFVKRHASQKFSGERSKVE